MLDPKAFSDCFMRWTQAIHKATKGEVIALDGKTIRHSFDTAMGQEALHIVSAWAVKAGVALGQIRVEPDTNENRIATQDRRKGKCGNKILHQQSCRLRKEAGTLPLRNHWSIANSLHYVNPR